ncbi:Deoxycytidine monophosphate (dCMP) deaminase [Pleurotus ostreatus]|nr:Deoxycytidine monophosphate (dCMP) deaminase [Pleurotus ostreatus]
MFIAIIGPQCSGKKTIRDYLVSKGFSPVIISAEKETSAGALPPFVRDAVANPVEALPGQELQLGILPGSLHFDTADGLLQHVTTNWRSHFVTTDLRDRTLIRKFVRRPFFMLMNVDAPLVERYRRLQSVRSCSLEEFIGAQDRHVYGNIEQPFAQTETPLISLGDVINLQVINSFASIRDLYAHLDALNLLDPTHLRPTWDAYFMTLASLASHRSNCMKRRVGAVLVRDNRIVATGYNGTPRGVPNCNEGGCGHCNGTTSSDKPLECVCLHAEENALLEAGRDRVGNGATMYCNTCPCLKCTVKIIQTGVKEVVYNLSYKVDDASGSLFKEAGIELRQYIPKALTYLSTSETHEGLSLHIPTIKLADS